jgi:hypothetical protein
MKRLLAAVLLLACAGAFAADCMPADEVSASQMLGLWRAEFEDRGPGATVLLEAHPEFAGNFRGAVNRDGERRQLAGDIDDGDLTLEESADGVHIAAVWVGEMIEGSCGREVRGAWKAEGAPGSRQFILRKQ